VMNVKKVTQAQSGMASMTDRSCNIGERFGLGRGGRASGELGRRRAMLLTRMAERGEFAVR
jgi:hypothetical protein